LPISWHLPKYPAGKCAPTPPVFRSFFLDDLYSPVFDFFQPDLVPVVPDFIQQLDNRAGYLAETARFLLPLFLDHQVTPKGYFTLIAINCALRNGDAHLKNFGIVYDDVQGEARLAPVYDLVTTSVYLPKDSMALTLNGATKWASAKELQRLGETRIGGTPARIREILARIAAAIADVSHELRTYIVGHQEFEEIGNRMRHEWQQGIALSLQAL
jgi:hypothetical protein